LHKANLSRAKLSGARVSRANLSEADLSEAELSDADFSGANLFMAILSWADLHEADLSETCLAGADLSNAEGSRANFHKADLSEAYLSYADLTYADLSSANLDHTDLSRAVLVGTKIDKAKLSGSSVYGINVWDLEGEFEEQNDLVITPEGAPIITVDNIKIAQFIYLILNNEEIRDVINTLTSKSVLILGRFADDERKAVLNALRNKLREYNLLPIVFDFERPIDRNITETVKTLAAISYFVIADVTSPKSSPLELQAIVPDLQIPVVPIIQESELPFSMIADLQSQHDGVLTPLTYHSEGTLIKALKAAVIDPAIEKHRELRLLKAQKSKLRKAEDFIDDKGLDSFSK